MSINHGPQRKEIQAKVVRSLAFNCSVCNCGSGSPGAMAFGLCLYLREYSPAPIPSSFRTHCAGCRPEGAPVGGSASLHNSGTGWWRALQIDGALLRWQVEPGIGLRGWVSGLGPTRPQCTLWEALPTGFPPACPPCIPLGSPSCCSSLDKESLSTLCLAALERMKLSTATVAFTSPDSRDPQVGQGMSQ